MEFVPGQLKTDGVRVEASAACWHRAKPMRINGDGGRSVKQAAESSQVIRLMHVDYRCVDGVQLPADTKTIQQARREGEDLGVSCPGFRDVWGPRCRSKIQSTPDAPH